MQLEYYATLVQCTKQDKTKRADNQILIQKTENTDSKITPH